MTKDEDYICKPYVCYKENCIDCITHISEITSKDAYNHLPNQRIIDMFHLENTLYTALEL